MSKHVSFPAAHLSSFDIGTRLQVVTTDGAKITDTLTKIVAKAGGGVTELYLTFESLNSNTSFSGAFQVDPKQFVKRVGK